MIFRCGAALSVTVFLRDIPEIATFIFTNSRDVTPLLLFQQIFKQQLLNIYLRFLELETARLND